MTARKQEIITLARSTGQQLAVDLGRFAADMNIADPTTPDKKLKKVVLAVTEVVEWIAKKRQLDVNDRRMEKLGTIRKALLAGGLHEPARAAGKPRQRYMAGGTTTGGNMTEVVANFPIKAGTAWAELKPHHRLAQTVWPM